MRKQCVTCDKPVGPQGTRFCSTECWYKFTKKQRTVACLVCGNQFERKYKTKKTCSVVCGHLLARKDRSVKCAFCDKMFTRPHGKSRTYCSRTCAMRARVAGGQFRHEDGSIRAHTSGYLLEKRAGEWYMQHRLIMAEYLGRPLEPFEHVHHKNGHRDDNEPDNLELWGGRGKSKKDPSGQRMKDLMNAFLSQPEVTDRAAVEIAFRRIFRI